MKKISLSNFQNDYIPQLLFLRIPDPEYTEQVDHEGEDDIVKVKTVNYNKLIVALKKMNLDEDHIF